MGGVVHVAAHIIVISISLIDMIIYKLFGLRFDITAIELFLQTNVGESREFLKTYLTNNDSLKYIGLFISIIILEIVCTLWLKKYFMYIIRFIRKDGWIYCFFCIGIFNVFYFFHPTFVSNRIHTHTFDEPILAQNVLWNLKNSTEELVEMQEEMVELENSQSDLMYDSCVELIPYEYEENPPRNIVLIIGETYNKYHSSLYDYPLKTTPQQQSFEPIVFKDVISPEVRTHEVFRAFLSANSAHDNWVKAPLFPALFKNYGWNVSFYSNQFAKEIMTKSKWNFLVDVALNRPKVDNACFDFHNSIRFDYDGDFVENLLNDQRLFSSENNNLTIIHFYGQHMDYSARYPKEQGHFSLDSINRPELDEVGKTWVMHYDNATYYNDIQIGRVLEAYQDSDAIIIATADHGEEIYDFRPKVGRSVVLNNNSPIELIKTHVDVPFLVFATNKFREQHPKTISLLEAATAKPFMIDDITHILLHLGGVHTAWYDAKKNPLHPEYDTTKHRILKIGDIDYDERCRGELHIGY